MAVRVTALFSLFLILIPTEILARGAAGNNSSSPIAPVIPKSGIGSSVAASARNAVTKAVQNLGLSLTDTTKPLVLTPMGVTFSVPNERALAALKKGTADLKIALLGLRRSEDMDRSTPRAARFVTSLTSLTSMVLNSKTNAIGPQLQIAIDNANSALAENFELNKGLVGAGASYVYLLSGYMGALGKDVVVEGEQAPTTEREVGMVGENEPVGEPTSDRSTASVNSSQKKPKVKHSRPE